MQGQDRVHLKQNIVSACSDDDEEFLAHYVFFKLSVQSHT